MKNYFILILFIGLLSGCKKDMMPEKESGVITSESIAHLKSWYNSQQSTQTNLSGSVFTASVGVIDWSNARFNVGEKTYIVPVTIPEQKKCFVFLTANIASDGNIISGKYIFINTDETQHKTITSSAIDLNFLEGKVIPNNFTGAIIEQNMQHKYLASKTFLNGNSSDLKKEMMVYKLKEFNNTEPTPDNAPLEQTCIDWYWQTWVNGILESEVYWFTTCTGGTGGSGGGGGTPDPNAECLSIGSAMMAAVCTVVPSSSLNMGTINSGPLEITVPVAPKGKSYVYNILFYAPSWGTFYTGVLSKQNMGDEWKWKSFNFSSFNRNGGSLPPFVVAVSTATVSTTFNDQTANAVGNFQITFDVNCGFNSQVGVKTNNIVDMFSAFWEAQ